MKLDKSFLEDIRYAGDMLKPTVSVEPGSLSKFKSLMFRDGLRISEKTTPLLSKKLNEACERLKIPPSSIDAFVFASSEAQAECMTGNGSTLCVIRFTSALIELLDEDEFSFVVGHELGHFLFDHTLARANKKASLEVYKYIRGQEITADRVGLLACGSINVAVRAMIKTVSGLSTKHLRFDISEFLSQLSKANAQKHSSQPSSTHPSMVARSKALLWFSMSKSYVEFPKINDPIDLKKIDEKIAKDLEGDSDSLYKEQISELVINFKFWYAVEKIVETGKFDKIRQLSMQNEFGVERVERLKSFLSSLSDIEAREHTKLNLDRTIKELEIVAPESFELEIENAKKTVHSIFKEAA